MPPSPFPGIAPEDEEEARPSIIGGFYGGAPVSGIPGPYGQISLDQVDGTEVAETAYAYRQGDEWKLRNNVAAIPFIQSQLIAAGELAEDNTRFGVWDDTSANAYGRVLAMANSWGVSAQQALAYLVNNPTPAMLKRAAGAKAPTRRIRLTNANDLQAVANEVAPRTIGRRFTDAELKKFVASYHSAERGETAGDPSVAAENVAQEVAPTEASARDLVDVYQGFLKMVTGG